MKLPRDLNIHTCFSCKGELLDESFNGIGVSLSSPQIFFDYKCPNCGHDARYTLELLTEMDPAQALIYLSAKLNLANIHAEPEKGNIKQQLNKITGVQDLLRLGGTDAPRERTKRNDLENLP